MFNLDIDIVVVVIVVVVVVDVILVVVERRQALIRWVARGHFSVNSKVGKTRMASKAIAFLFLMPHRLTVTFCDIPFLPLLEVSHKMLHVPKYFDSCFLPAMYDWSWATKL